MAAGVGIEDPGHHPRRPRRGGGGGRACCGPTRSSRAGPSVRAGAVVGPFARLVDARGRTRARRSSTTACCASAWWRRAPPSGPFAHIRPETPHRGPGQGRQLRRAEEDDARRRAPRPRTSRYIGDATVGPGVNIGAGTITCNYDGVHKHPTRDRGGRLHRQRHHAGGSGDGRRGRLRRRGQRDHRGRARGRAGPRPGPPGDQAGLGGRAWQETCSEASRGSARRRDGRRRRRTGRTDSGHVRHRRLRRIAGRRPRHRGGTAAARVPRLRLRGGRRRRDGALSRRRSRGQAPQPRGEPARGAAARAPSASATRAGPPTAGPARRTPTRTRTARARSWSSTTGSSRTTCP